jgi:hypothetical protein
MPQEIPILQRPPVPTPRGIRILGESPKILKAMYTQYYAINVEGRKEDNTSPFKLPVEIFRTILEYVHIVSVGRIFLKATRQLQTLVFETQSIWHRIWLSGDAIPNPVSVGSTQMCTSEGSVTHISKPDGTLVHRKVMFTLGSDVGVTHITERHTGLLRRTSFSHTSTLCIMLNQETTFSVITSSLCDALQGSLPLESLMIARPHAVVENFHDGLSITPCGIFISPLHLNYIPFENVHKHFTTSSPTTSVRTTATRNSSESLNIQVFPTPPNIVLSSFSGNPVTTLTPYTLHVDLVKFLPELRTKSIYLLLPAGILSPSLRVLKISSPVSSFQLESLWRCLSKLDKEYVDCMTAWVVDGGDCKSHSLLYHL